MRGERKTALSPLQVAVYERLAGDLSLMGRVTGILDDVNEGQSFPYVTLGETTVVDFSTKTQYGEEVSYTFHIWSDHNGQKEAKEIMSLVIEAISREPIRFSGFIVLFSKLDFMNVFDDPDGLRHGVIRINFRIFQEVK